MKYKLKQIRLNAIVHTPTEEEAKELLHILHESGYKWLSGNSLDSLNNPFAKVYYIDNDKMVQFGSLETAIENGCTILPLAELKEKCCEEEKPRFRLGERIRIVSSGEEDFINMITKDVCYELLEHRGTYMESDLEPYTEPTEELNEDNFIKTENMEITDIIGKGKDFEPPFKVEKGDAYYNPVVKDSTGKVIACTWGDAYKGMTPEKANITASHICELLNREHNRQRRMCIRDKNKVCNKCHDCDIDVLNPGDKYAGY